MNKETKTVTHTVGNKEEFNKKVTQKLATVSVVRYKEGVSVEVTGSDKDILLCLGHAVLAFSHTTKAPANKILEDLEVAVTMAKLEKGVVDSDTVEQFFKQLLGVADDENR